MVFFIPINEYSYSTYYKYARKVSKWFACIQVEHIGEKNYIYQIPVFMIKLDTSLELVCQMKQIQSIQLLDENTLKIEGPLNDVYYLDVNNYSLQCINNALEQSTIEYINDQDSISKEFSNIYEQEYEYLEEFEYSHAQPEKTEIKNMEQLFDVCSVVLYEIYGKEKIEKERPYNIVKYKSYYLVFGSLIQPKPQKEGIVVSVRGGVFEIIVDPENSQVLYLIHSK